MTKRILPWLLALLLLFAGCQGAPEAGRDSMKVQTSAGSAPEMAYDRENKGIDTGSGGKSGLSIGPVQPDQKIVYNVYFQMQTTDFSAAAERLKDLTAELGGYIEGSEVSSGGQGGFVLRTGHYTLRIPTAKLNDFFARAGEVGHVISERLDSTDVTLEFIDTEARLKALKQQEERILEILQKADSLQYVLEIERELSQIRGQIESMTSMLNRLSSRVDYSTVALSLREVVALSDVKPTPKSFGERLSAVFSQSVKRLTGGLQEAGLWLLGNSVEIVFWLAILALAAWLVWRVAWHCRKKAKEKATRRYQAAVENGSPQE